MRARLHVLGLCLVMASCSGGIPALALVGCATQGAPRVQTKTVDIPVPVHCHPILGPEPAYADSDAALHAAPDIYQWVRAMAEGRLQRIQRDIEKSAALQACE